MQVTETNVDGLKHEFKVVVPAAQIEEKIEDRLQQLSHEVRLPGFRPGKVPVTLMRKRYRASVMGEVLEAVVQQTVDGTLSDRNLRPAMQPKIEIVSFEDGKDLEFTIAVEVLPEITAPDFSALTLEKPVASVPDSEIDDALNRIAAARGEAVELAEARPAVSGDVVTIDFLGKVDGVAFDGGAGTDYDLELGSGSFIPGFEEQLIGASSGDARVVAVTFPEDYGHEPLAGKAAEFEVTVKAIKEKKAPAIDDDLAKSMGMDDLEALRKIIREQIEREFAGLTRGKMKRQLLDLLAEAVSFPVPQGMVDAEFDAIWQQVEEALKNDQLDEDDKGKSEDELRTEYRTLSERRVRLGLLLADIGQKNGVQVSQEDLNRAVMQEAMRYPGQEQAVFRYFQSNPDAVNSLRAPLYEDKVVDFVIALAKVEEKSVSPSDLTGESESDAA